MSVFDELEKNAPWPELLGRAIAHGRALEARVKELEREAEKRAETIRLAFQADVEKKARIVKLEAENARLEALVKDIREAAREADLEYHDRWHKSAEIREVLEAENAVLKAEYSYFSKLTENIHAELQERLEELESLRRIRDAAAEWKEFTEKNGGDYLPGHAQRIYAALAAHAAKFGEGKNG